MAASHGPSQIGSMVVAWAPAKVNLTLHVGPPQPNGRHPLRALTIFPDGVHDRIRIAPAARLSLRLEGRFADQVDCASEDNLAIRAARALADHVGRAPNVEITVQKALPVAAGIGGGSADAGAVLRALEAFWKLAHGSAASVAPALGGDVPASYVSKPVIMEGEGERLTSIVGLPELHIVLVNPGLACPTGPVFRRHDADGRFAPLGSDAPPTENLDVFLAWLSANRNDLEPAAIALVPEISGVLDTLRAQAGAALVRMSGSGATCFALFPRLGDAEAATYAVSRAHPDWWVGLGRFGGAG